MDDNILKTDSKESEYKRHLATRKHQNNDKNAKKNACVCGRAFMHRQGLHVHRKKCSQYITKGVSDYDFEHDTIDGNKNENMILGDNNSICMDDQGICSHEKSGITKEMFMSLLKDNQEMMKMIKS